MTQDELLTIVERLWSANRGHSTKLAEVVFAAHKLPPAAPILISNLDALLSDLQKRSFALGALAALNDLGLIEPVSSSRLQ